MQDNNNSFTLNININNKQYLGLLDTGTSTSLISNKIIENENLKSLINKNELGYIEFLNNNQNITGRILLNTIIENKKIQFSPFILSDLPYDIILGRDFMFDNKIIINFDNNTITLNNNIINNK
jgi:hypothetical protein